MTNPDFLTVKNDVQQRNIDGASVTARIINGWHNSFDMSALGPTGISIANMQQGRMQYVDMGDGCTYVHPIISTKKNS